MEPPAELAATFLAHAQGRVAPPSDTLELGHLLGHALEEARTRWPSVNLSTERFLRHLAERLPKGSTDEPATQVVERLCLVELYLTCACTDELPAAIETFERDYLGRLPGLLGYLKQPASTIDEVCQRVRVDLLVRPVSGGRLRIGEYAGRGMLLSWLKSTAARIAIKLLNANKPAPEQEEEEKLLKGLPEPGHDLEMKLIKQHHYGEFRRALLDAFSELSSDQRHLLRLYCVDGLSTTELGSLFRVNQSTASRWLKDAREEIYEGTKRRLQERLGLSSRDFKSFMAVLDSQLDMSISQIFGDVDKQG